MGASSRAPVWKYVRDQPQWKPYTLPDPSDTAKLREEIAAWVGRVWSHDHDMPNDERLRQFNILSLETEFREYIAQNGSGLFEDGMTIDEIWFSTQLYCASHVVTYMAEPYFHLASERVEPKRSLPTDQLVWLLGAICLKFQINTPMLNVLVTNGEFGHTIVLSGLNGLDFLHPGASTFALVGSHFTIPGLHGRFLHQNATTMGSAVFLRT